MIFTEKQLKKYTPKRGHVLALKSLPANLVARNNFQWPETGRLAAPDWMPTKKCGNGLHGWKWGEGDASLNCSDDDAKWLVLMVEECSIINLEGKVKFPVCDVLFVGTREEAVAIICHFAPTGSKVIFGTATAGYKGTATAGDSGTATAGDSGTATAGNEGTATAGYKGTATAGDSGTATAGNEGTATAGNKGTATAGNKGTATAGEMGILILTGYDNKIEKSVRKIALVDGVNYLPGVKYRLNADLDFIEAKDEI